MARGGSTPPDDADVEYEWLNVDENGEGGFEAWILMSWHDAEGDHYGSRVVEYDPAVDTRDDVEARALEDLRG